jgi:hypothetical protein
LQACFGKLRSHHMKRSFILTPTQYCGLACQKFHWSSHKVECRDPLNKTRWIPEWERANRTPAWATGEAPQNLYNPFGSSKYLWGNAPAIDIAQMAQNEGKTHDRDITLLFAGEFTICDC